MTEIKALKKCLRMNQRKSRLCFRHNRNEKRVLFTERSHVEDPINCIEGGLEYLRQNAGKKEEK